jgi:hypothetical protein
MDAEPNCAICSAPPNSACPCESERLQIAMNQAEARAMDDKLALIRYDHPQTYAVGPTDHNVVTGSSTMRGNTYNWPSAVSSHSARPHRPPI